MLVLVLIVEDNLVTRNALTTLIGRQGHSTITAATVRQGLDRLGSSPSHVLLDMDLPDGLGMSILQRVRAEHLPMKVAFLSGCVDRAVMSQSALLLPDAMFPKPTDVDALLNWIAA